MAGPARSSSMNVPAQRGTFRTIKAMPVKNTFIHFGVNDDGADDGPWHGRDGSNSSGAEQLQFYDSPSLSSSSDTGRERRPASAHALRRVSSSSSDRGCGLNKPKAQVAPISGSVVQESMQSEQLGRSPSEMCTMVGDSSASGTLPRQAALEGFDGKHSPTAEASRGAGWTDSAMSMLSGMWENGAGVPSSSTTPAPLQDLDSLQPKQLLRRVPRNEEGDLTSLGSVTHQEGKCSPCSFWFKGACSHGVACKHCHFDHECQRPKRLRPSKHARERQRLRMEKEKEAGEQPVARAPEEHWMRPSPFTAQLAQAVQQARLRVATSKRGVKQQMSL